MSLHLSVIQFTAGCISQHAIGMGGSDSGVRGWLPTEGGVNQWDVHPQTKRQTHPEPQREGGLGSP